MRMIMLGQLGKAALAATDPTGGFVLTSEHIGWAVGIILTAVSVVGGYYKIRAGMRAEATAQAAEIKVPIERLTKAVEGLDAKLKAELYPLHEKPLAAQVKALREGQDRLRLEIKALEADNMALRKEIADLREAQLAAPAAIQALGRDLSARLGPIENGLKALLPDPPRRMGG